MAIGVVCARYVNPLNPDHDEGTYSACRVLRQAVLRSITADLSPSASMATAAIGQLGMACIDVGKITTLQEPIRNIRWIGGQTAEKWPHVANQAAARLAQLTIEVAVRAPRHLMASKCAEDAIEGMGEIIAKPDQWAGGANALTVPLSPYTIPRVAYELARAAGHSPDATGMNAWDWQCVAVANLALSMPGRTDLAGSIRSNAAECCQEILLSLLSLPYRDATIKLVADRFGQFVEQAVGGADTLNGRRTLGELLLYTYYRSRQLTEAAPLLRQLIMTAAASIGSRDARTRRGFAAMLRRVGAAALHFDDTVMAEAMARASLPPMPTTSKAIRLQVDLFESGGWIGETFHHRPGLPPLTLEGHHLDADAQRKYLQLENRIDRSQNAR